MEQRLFLLHGGEPSSNLIAAKALATSLGIESAYLPIDAVATDPIAPTTDGGVLIVDVASLDEAPANGIRERAMGMITAWPDAILLLATTPGNQMDDNLNRLSGSTVAAITSVHDAADVRFLADGENFSRELARQTYSRTRTGGLGLTVTAHAGWTPIMAVGPEVSFGCWLHGTTQHFVWATPSIFDPTVPIENEREFETALDRFIPLVIFLRTTFGEQCWHNPNATAGFVIDDPLLRPRYGFIDFPRLLASARTYRYNVSLAFIPWNAWRTSSTDAALFRSYNDIFELCVHGCDHTYHEYGSTDFVLLLVKNRVAVARMQRQAKRTGLAFSPLMVCPQEQCSLEAWHACASSPHLLGLVNSTCLPRNVKNRIVRGADMLLPAQDAHYGFPVFKRQYAGSFAPFALMLFLGKPAILVEHHDFFKDGLDSIENHVRRLTIVSPAVQWRTLGEIALTTHQRRCECDSRTAIRFFTRRFKFTPQNPTKIYRMRKRVCERDSVADVTVNGIRVPFDFESEFVVFDVHPDQPGVHEVRIKSSGTAPRPVRAFGLAYRSGVASRRFLCEFRDNVVSRNEASAAIARRLTHLMHHDMTVPCRDAVQLPRG